MSFRIPVLALALTLAATAGAAGAAESAGSLEAGRQTVETVCAACHGLDGQGAATPVTPVPPRIGGQVRLYLADRLERYRSGDLEHPLMSAVARGLSDADIDNVSEWYSRIKIDSPWFTQEAAMGMIDDSADPAMTPARTAGKIKAAQVCANCHGLYGQALVAGNADVVPNLTAQQPGFVSERLRDYRAGKRQSNQMGFIARMLSDADIDNLAAWYAGIEIDVTDPRRELAPPGR